MKTFARLFLVVLFPLQLFAEEAATLRKERDKLVARGLWREVIDHYRGKLLPVSDGNSGEDLLRATKAVEELHAWEQLDELIEHAVAAHPENTALLISAADAYSDAPHLGVLVAGEFQRGDYRYRPWPGSSAGAAAGATVETDYRDRIRQLQLLRQALAHVGDDMQRSDAWGELADALRNVDAWKLQTLTPLDTLPEWGEPGPEGGTEGAPWSKDRPVLYDVPPSWEAAKSDGERWRFALAEQARLKPKSAGDTVLDRASFSRSQFGVRTLSPGWWRQGDPESEKGILEIDTLTEDECLAKTSDGVRRFKLPPDHHFIALLRSILDESSHAGDVLTEVFLDRRQYDKARDVLERTIAKHGPGDGDSRKKLLEQITGNWGRFEMAETVSKGTKPTLPLIFRNATEVALTVAPVDMEAMLNDTVAYVKSNPAELDWDRLHPSRIAYRLIEKERSKYIGKAAEAWEVKLTPRDKHRDTRADLTVPVDQAGAWWVSGKMKNGNEFFTLIWIVDGVLIERDVAGKLQWWFADAESGEPVADAEIQFFGYRTIHHDRKLPLVRRTEVVTKEFKRKTDAEGKTLLKPGDWDERCQWLAIARKPGRAPAFYDFRSYHISEPSQEGGGRNIGYGMTDRPLYKPGDTVHLKFYLRNAGYFEADESRWANKTGTLTLRNGRGEEALKIENLKTDALGAVETEAILPKNAVLGSWRATFQIGDRMSSTVVFQVEEYRKPEFEVIVEAPDEPIELGDKFAVTVKANYFHGAPVRKASVEVTVKRSSLTDRWFPQSRWDWLYGPGAWWLEPAATWHPTWERWGCMPPPPPWWGRDRWTPDELVISRKLPIGPDGTTQVEIDTALAKRIHGDMDAKYSIEARVVDASRREERGLGSVIAARKPFEVVVWMNRGYAKSGDAVEATIAASTLAGKPVAGAKGTLTVYQLVKGEEGRIDEKEIQSWPVETDAEGRIVHPFAAPATGQFRVAAKLALKGGEAVEGATILNVHGTGRENPDGWRFGPIELISDKSEYQPGETLKLRVNSDHANAHVWLFLHVTGRAGREAKLVRLDGKSSEIEIPLDFRDMPNTFIECVTVHGAKVHTAVRQVLLPPVSKLIDVTLEPAKSRVKPQEKSSLKITLRDLDGKPVSGTTVLAIYDKALEAITGGSNVGPIHENFWQWKNEYYQHGVGYALPGSAGNLLRPRVTGMENLGSFGDELALVGNEGGFGSGWGVNRGQLMADGLNAAPPASAPMMEMAKSVDAFAAAGEAPATTPIHVRKDFADLLKWAGSIETDANGQAEIPLEFPDNLTTWKARVWTLLPGTRVGEGSAEIITSKELLVRLQAPRFLVERDEAVLSAVVHNDHDAPKNVRVSLELEGASLETIEAGAQTVEIAAKSEARIDWRVKALKEGEAIIRMKADAGDDGDAVERKLPVLVHGMARQDAWSRMVNPDQSSATISMEVPEQRRPDQSKLTIRFSPTIAGAVVDAIPYLASYPHGCTEQTLNRFVPAVIAQRMLKDLKINLDEVRAKRTNLNPQELGHADDRAAQWKQWKENPVFDEAVSKKMVSAGVEKLMSMQNSDGGWGWFSGYGESSYPHTTAVVVHGLLVAKSNGEEVPKQMLESGIAWLMVYERKQVAALELHVAREAIRKVGGKINDEHLYEKHRCDATDAFVRMVLGEAGRDSEAMREFLYRDRIELPIYAKCLVGLEEHRHGDVARRDELMRMISQYLKRDEENQTAYLELRNRDFWWFWYGSEVEAHAWYLKLLATVKPQDADTRGLVKYLVNNRKHATYWDSTRDTAYAIEAIAAYFKASGEDAPEMNVEISLDGKTLRKVSIDRDNLFTFDGTVMLTGEAVTSGKHQVEIRKSGNGTLYANAYLEVFTLEDDLRAAGLEVKVQRRVSKLIPLEKETEVPDAAGLIAKQQVERFRREPLADGATVKSGERIEVELILESKNDYEYLIFSDAKAAGFEAIDALSGYISGGPGFAAYMEPRDRSVDFFIRSLPRGTHTLHYQLRAETPGVYKALPATAEAMYAPELRGNSEDFKIGVAPMGSE